MQRSGTESIRTQNQPSKLKREITYITNCQNTKITYGQLGEQLFPKSLPLSNRNGTKNNLTIHKVKRHRNSDTKNRQRRTTTKIDMERSVMNYWGSMYSLTYIYIYVYFQEKTFFSQITHIGLPYVSYTR